MDFQKATDKARAREAARKNGGAVEETALAKTEQVIAIDLGGEFASPTELTIAKVTSGEWSAAPQIMDLEKGVTYTGWLEGNGPQVEVEDPVTRELKPVDSWIMRGLKNPTVRISFLTTVQLDQKLPEHVGGEVSITKLEQRDSSKNRRYWDFFVAGARAAKKNQTAS